MEKECEVKYEIMTRFLRILIEEKGYVNIEDIKLILKALGETNDK